MDNRVKGLGEFMDYLAKSPIQMHIGVRAGLYAGARIIELQAKANCPVGAPAGEGALSGLAVGALRDSIHVVAGEKGDKIYATVVAGGHTADGVSIPYAHLIEYSGAAAHVIRSRGKKLSIGGKSFAAINHPGMKAHPFLRPALDAREGAAVDAVDRSVQNVLNNKAP